MVVDVRSILFDMCFHGIQNYIIIRAIPSSQLLHRSNFVFEITLDFFSLSLTVVRNDQHFPFEFFLHVQVVLGVTFVVVINFRMCRFLLLLGMMSSNGVYHVTKFNFNLANESSLLIVRHINFLDHAFSHRCTCTTCLSS